MKKRTGILSLIILMLLLIGLRHHDWLRAPTEQYVGDTHDGFRSFLASVYHVRYDSTFTWYQGMNYPYGDRTVFSGCQPLFTNGVKWIHENIVEIPEAGPVVIQSMILLSLLLSALFLYLLFQKLKLPVVYSIVVAIGLTFLSPQLDRFSGHYGLSYTFVIPLCLYLLYLFEEEKKWKWSLVMGGFLYLLSWAHLYMFALVFFTISLFFFFRVISHFSWSRLGLYARHWIVQCFLAFFLVQLWVWYADPITDRPNIPYGFKVYIAHWQTVLFSPATDFGQEMLHRYPVKPFATPEGYAWVGSTVPLLLIGCLAGFAWRIWKKETTSWGSAFDRSYLWSIGGAAFLLLLFSFGIPFIYRAFTGLEEYIGPLRQFRSLGRFAWMFVYVSNVALFYCLYQQYRLMKNRKLGMILLILATGLLSYEAFHYANYHKKRQPVYPVPALRAGYKAADIPWYDQIDPDRYQAILPLPYYHIGSENIWMQVDGGVMHHSLWASVKTGLPLTAVFMTRTSISQTLRQLELIGEPYRVPKILKGFPNEKPLLIYVYKHDYEKVWYRYDHLMYGLKAIYEDHKVRLYELPLWVIKNRVTEKAQQYRSELEEMTLFETGELKSKDSLSDFVYRSFDELEADRSYRSGAAAVIGTKGMELFEGSIPGQLADSRYVFSLWSFAREDLHMKNWMHLIERDSSGHILQESHYELNKYIRSVDNDWVLADVPFYLKSADSQLTVLIDNQDLRHRPFYIDELQIRRQNAVLFREGGEEFSRNNRWFSLNKEQQ